MSQDRLPEEMASFFNSRHDSYDQHMRDTVPAFEAFYRSVAAQMVPIGRPLRILDLGCGTGIELGPVFERFPDAFVSGIDMSPKMLELLAEKFGSKRSQLDLKCGSYMELPLGENQYDYVTSVMSAHHFLPAEKVELYKRIRRSLRTGGAYIEADWIVDDAKMQEYMTAFRRKRDDLAASGTSGLHHIDIPFTLVKQKELLLAAGFGSLEVVFVDREDVTLVAR